MIRRKIVVGFLLLLTFSFPSLHAITLEEARHLLSRAGFGASPGEINHFLPETYEQAVDEILNTATQAPQTPPPSWATQWNMPSQKPKEMRPEEKMAFEKILQNQRLELKAWWYQEMVATPSPVTEHMTLFWHNHFTSSLEKVHWPVLMYRQNLLLRQYALGNFQKMLIAISRDPAMILYLDTQSNHKAQPNENFARELMELFTLGEGRYTEKDVQEAARAFTGWQVDMKTGNFVERPPQHDDGDKVFLGQKGNFEGDNILYILLTQPRVSEFITEKLWREFISETPDPQEVKRLATRFRNNNFEIRPLLRDLFLSPAFRDPKNRGVLTKSPVDLMVGTIRTFNMPIEDTMPLVVTGKAMGMDLLDPPNVKGWAGGESWISTYTLLTRRQFLARLLRGKEMEGHAMNPQSMMTAKDNHDTLHGIDLNDWMGKSGFKDEQDLQAVTAILLPVPPVDQMPLNADLPRQIRELVMDPVYQLK